MTFSIRTSPSQIQHLPQPLSTLLIFLTLIAIVLLLTNFITQIRYHLSLRRYSKSHSRVLLPPRIPYTIPILGSALSFLAPYPSSFWTYIFSIHPRSIKCLTLLLGGRTMHVVFSAAGVETLFRQKDLSRDGFTRDIAMKGLGLSRQDANAYFGLEGDVVSTDDGESMLVRDWLEKFNHEWLLKAERVNELTAEFMRSLKLQVDGTLSDGKALEIGLYEFMRPLMFHASTRAFMGSSILEICPDLCREFFEFDQVMLTLFYGVPNFLARKENAIREKAVGSLTRWHEAMYSKYHGRPLDPRGDVAWEPDYGCKVNRLKQTYYEQRSLSLRARASYDLGFLFGLSSNAIPATGWILMHILDPHGDATLLPRVMAELSTARRDDGDFDVPTLVSLPLLQSILQETLRLYVDAFVTRELFRDLVLPLDDGRHALFRKDSMLMAPTYVAHHDVTLWHDPGPDTWCADRFLKTDPQTGKATFSTSSKGNARIFPFGGGRTICPGRVFAKQEVLGAVAVFLSAFEWESLRYQTDDGGERETFPGLRRSFGGSAVMVMDADVRVKVRKRK